MPIMLHCFDILRVNSYILYHETSVQHKEIDDDKILGHKDFLIEFTDCLIRRAKSVDEGEKSTTRGKLQDTTVVHHHHEPIFHSGYFSRNNPSLTDYDTKRFRTGVHRPVRTGKQNKCVYCRYLYLKAVQASKNTPNTRSTIDTSEPEVNVTRSRSKCSICDAYLCPDHFGVFHGW